MPAERPPSDRRPVRQNIYAVGTRSPIRVFILGDHAIYRHGLRLLLDAEPDFHVVGDEADGEKAREPVRRGQADVLLLDIATSILPERDALRALTTICAPTRVMVLAPSFDNSQITDALRLGVRGVVLKDVSAETLFKSLRSVASGQYWVGREIVADLVESLRAAPLSMAAPQLRRGGRLTRREWDVASFVIAGCANKEIADKCGMSERTVKHHLTNMYDKLGVATRLELALFALGRAPRRD